MEMIFAAVSIDEDGKKVTMHPTEAEAWTAIVARCSVPNDEEQEELEKMLAEAKESEDFSELEERIQAHEEVADYYFVTVLDEALPKPRVVVVLEGGAVTAILTTLPVDVAIVDYDTEEVDEDQLFPMPQGKDRTADACGSIRAAEVSPARANEMYEAVENAKQ